MNPSRIKMSMEIDDDSLWPPPPIDEMESLRCAHSTQAANAVSDAEQCTDHPYALFDWKCLALKCTFSAFIRWSSNQAFQKCFYRTKMQGIRQLDALAGHRNRRTMCAGMKAKRNGTIQQQIVSSVGRHWKKETRISLRLFRTEKKNIEKSKLCMTWLFLLSLSLARARPLSLCGKITFYFIVPIVIINPRHENTPKTHFFLIVFRSHVKISWA